MKKLFYVIVMMLMMASCGNEKFGAGIVPACRWIPS